MDIIDNQIKNIVDPVASQDAMTMNSAQNTAGGIPRVWVNGAQKTSVKEFFGSATVSSGNVTFNMTTDGTATGPAIFTNVYTESINLFVFDVANQYQFSGLSIAASKKTLTITVGRLGSVLIGIIQFVTAANGVTVYLQVKGD